MTYILDEKNTNTTYDSYFSVVGKKNMPTNKLDEIQLLDVSESFQKLKKYFSKVTYEYFSINERKTILEYLISNYASKQLNIFAEYRDLDYKITDKKELLKYFCYHLIILYSDYKYQEDESYNPLKVINELETAFLSDKENGYKMADFYLQSKKIFSNLPMSEIVKIRLEDSLILISLKEDLKIQFNLVIYYLILLNNFDPFL